MSILTNGHANVSTLRWYKQEDFLKIKNIVERKDYFKNYCTLIVVSNPRVLSMGNHLGPFSESSDRPEDQEQAAWAVGGQGDLRGVTRLPSMLETCFF